MNRGLDISIIQGNVDFKAVKDSGVDFVVIRCGIGNDGIDTNYKANVSNARNAGLLVMAYHFPYPLPDAQGHSNRDPVSQANIHWKAAQGELAAIDLEWPAPQDWSKWGVTAQFIDQWIQTYLGEYTKLDNRVPVVYTYPNFAESVKFSPTLGQYPLWIASYEAQPTIPAPWTDWVMWQTSGGSAHLPNGVPVDADVSKDLHLWGV